MAETVQTAKGKIRYGPYPELTLPGILVGYVIGSLIAVSIGYASLRLGFSIEGSELAAILGFAVLRGAMRRTSIIENNINQSLASSVNAASAGMMFSVPALFMLGYGNDFNVPLMVLGCMTGGVLGIAFIIPLRKQMIDFERLAFPGGIAVATILKSPGAGMRKAYYLMGGAVLAGLVHAVSLSTGIHELALGDWIGMPVYMNGIWSVSLMTIGVGFLSGRGGVYFIVGGYVCFWILAPILNYQELIPQGQALIDAGGADMLRTSLFRPLGIGMLIGGALTGVALALPLIFSAVRSMQEASKTTSAVSRDELPIRMLYYAVLGGFLLMLVMASLSVPEMTILRAAAMAVLGTLWVWMAGVILSECIGRTNWSPLSGMTLIAVTILIFIANGMGNDRSTVIAAVMVGAAACVAMSQATDLMLDLKTGYLVGAIPRKQQIAQFLGTWLGPILVMGLIFVLHNDQPLGGTKYPAPQGQALASIIDGILGGDVPTQKYLAGAGIGAVLSASGVGGLGILVGLGFYLPFAIVLTYTIGTIARVSSDRWVGKRFSEEVGIPIAAGLIVGEALVGVGNALYQIALAAGSGGGG